MNRVDCDRIRDEIPALLADRLPAAAAMALRGHLDRCADCRAEAEVVAMLRRHPLAVPARLEEQVRERLSRGRARRLAPVLWPLAIAASAGALLLGGRSLLRPGAPLAPPAAPYADVAAGERLIRPFSGSPGTDGLLAGGVVTDALSDEELELLLAEMDS